MDVLAVTNMQFKLLFPPLLFPSPLHPPGALFVPPFASALCHCLNLSYTHTPFIYLPLHYLSCCSCLHHSLGASYLVPHPCVPVQWQSRKHTQDHYI